MNFKEKYQQDYQSVKPDDRWKAELASQMNRVSGKSTRRPMYAVAGVVAMAAMTAIIIGVSRKEDSPSANSEDFKKDIEVMAEANTTKISGFDTIDTEKWYGDAQTDEEIYQCFLELLQNEKTEEIYCSEKEVFNSGDELDGQEREELMEALLQAENAEQDISDKGKNYMIVFENGDIVKFKLSEDGFVQLKK